MVIIILVGIKLIAISPLSAPVLQSLKDLRTPVHLWAQLLLLTNPEMGEKVRSGKWMGFNYDSQNALAAWPLQSRKCSPKYFNHLLTTDYVRS